MSLEQAAQLTEPQVGGLLAAYVERKRFEARIAMSILGEALKPKREQGSLASLAALGFGIKGAEWPSH